MQKKSHVYTIGHGEQALDDFITSLKRSEVTALVDIRKNRPALPSYEPRRLKDSLKQEKIAYVYLGKELGASRSTRNKDFEMGIERLLNGMETYTLTIMGEAEDPSHCQRSIVSQALEQLDIQVTHLRAEGALCLTGEQQAIVSHDRGPAVVFAVAGAGKTTSMVHRIERLVREGQFTAKSIFATSFSRETVGELIKRLKPFPHCRGVDIRTLHSLGYLILKQAHRARLFPAFKLHIEDNEDQAIKLVNQTFYQARRERIDMPSNIDIQDFLNYVSACKGNLQYADLSSANLPQSALTIATQASAPRNMPHYLDLFIIFETLRRKASVITFDDMLCSSWELLIRHENLCQSLQKKYQSILVDEYQDLNLAQHQILDILVRPHQNYMVIGDDDQTIYEWRGASSSFILNFAEQYGATKYYLSDNFRSGASHLALANQVIKHNKKRETKTLHLSRGFEGHTSLHFGKDRQDSARQLVQQVKLSLSEGYSCHDIVILIRLYAQTPYLEQAFITAGLDYTIIGEVPFYERREILILLAYIQLTLLEQQLQAGMPLSREDKEDLIRYWKLAHNSPTRYMTKVVSQQVLDRVIAFNQPLSQALSQMAQEVDQIHLSKNLKSFAHLLQWLPNQMSRLSASQFLSLLEQELGLCDYLKKSSAIVEVGQERADTVIAFIDYSIGRGNCMQFLTYLKNLPPHEKKPNSIKIMTIFRAKGLEWPVVLIPDCNETIYPYGELVRKEEERRLLYVALTRTQQELHLFINESENPSSFLKDAKYEQTLNQIELMAQLLELPPQEWTSKQTLDFIKWTHYFGFHRYFSHWTSLSDKILEKVQLLMTQLKAQDLFDKSGLSPYHHNFWQGFGNFLREPLEGEMTDLTSLIPTLKKKKNTQIKSVFEEGQRVYHQEFGAGEILEIKTQHRAVVLQVEFESFGLKKLIERYADLRAI